MAFEETSNFGVASMHWRVCKLTDDPSSLALLSLFLDLPFSQSIVVPHKTLAHSARGNIVTYRAPIHSNF
eukprot:m.105824 g.105824  ORF g.105824 m.105824 type:complete len:70 (+) comp13287_c2_seq1:384-593(+)